MEFLQPHHLNQLGLWTPLIGGLLLYIGLNIKITEVDTHELNNLSMKDANPKKSSLV